MSHKTVTLVKVGNQTLAVDNCTRILSSYEFRMIPGTIIRATHFGTSILDLSQLATGKPSLGNAGILTSNEFGFLVDEVIGQFQIESQTALPDFVTNLEGIISSAIVTTKAGKFPLVDIEAIYKLHTKQIAQEVSVRRLS
jgi:hypothetical protein